MVRACITSADPAAVTQYEGSQVAHVVSMMRGRQPAAVSVHVVQIAILSALRCVRVMTAVGAEPSGALRYAGARLGFGPSGRFNQAHRSAGFQTLVPGRGG